MGIRPVAMVEPAGRVTARWPARLLPKLLRIPLMLGTELTAIHGRSRVTGVDLVGPDGNTRHVEADGVIVTGGFVPESALLKASHLAVDPASGGPDIDQFGRCSDPAYFAAGNLLRAVETAGWSWAEGRRAGRTIAYDLKTGLLAPKRRAAGGAAQHGAEIRPAAAHRLFGEQPMVGEGAAVSRHTPGQRPPQPARRRQDAVVEADRRPARTADHAADIHAARRPRGPRRVPHPGRRQMNTLAIDQGTTSTRALVVDAGGRGRRRLLAAASPDLSRAPAGSSTIRKN